eukprot:TRINITY_DN20557_c0_g1_i1.p1 TRINITY_DN20557_c0_g1~~TRINITY_DN20557_c0_g1_i1.p1  ORF type:complete len:337 (+),score=55.84 TRINITY_DN20557_c0_g1_i1:37-1047(+)
MSDSSPPQIDNYGDARIQALMLNDAPRTRAYETAIKRNSELFANKVILDVGCGQGILSLFCARAGAKKVYAVERTSMAGVAKAIVKENGYEDVIEVHQCTVDALSISEQVDVIVSEWMGVGLIHERMLEVVISARDNFLKPDGTIFPTTATLCLSPVADDGSEGELYAANCWNQQSVYGFSWSSAAAMLPYHGPKKKPGIGFPLQRVLLPPSRIADTAAEHKFDLRNVSMDDVRSFSFRFSFPNIRTTLCGVAFWFRVDFIASHSVVLGTSPLDPPTHWRQLVWYFDQPRDQIKKLSGRFTATANPKTCGYKLKITNTGVDDMKIDTVKFLWHARR